MKPFAVKPIQHYTIEKIDGEMRFAVIVKTISVTGVLRNMFSKYSSEELAQMYGKDSEESTTELGFDLFDAVSDSIVGWEGIVKEGTTEPLEVNAKNKEAVMEGIFSTYPDMIQEILETIQGITQKK